MGSSFPERPFGILKGGVVPALWGAALGCLSQASTYAAGYRADLQAGIHLCVAGSIGASLCWLLFRFCSGISRLLTMCVALGLLVGVFRTMQLDSTVMGLRAAAIPISMLVVAELVDLLVAARSTLLRGCSGVLTMPVVMGVAAPVLHAAQLSPSESYQSQIQHVSHGIWNWVTAPIVLSCAWMGLGPLCAWYQSGRGK